MPEAFRLYLDQMIQKYVAEVLSKDGYDVVRASEVGQARGKMDFNLSRLTFTATSHCPPAIPATDHRPPATDHRPPAMHKLHLYYHTLKHLKPVQIYGLD
jgi:hypothetical protein